MRAHSADHVEVVGGIRIIVVRGVEKIVDSFSLVQRDNFINREKTIGRLVDETSVCAIHDKNETVWNNRIQSVNLYLKTRKHILTIAEIKRGKTCMGLVEKFIAG